MGLEKKNKYLGINCAHPLYPTRSYHPDKKKVRYCINERTTVEWYKQIVESHNGFIVLICRHCTRILCSSPSLDFPYVGWGALCSDCPELSLSMCLSNSHNRLLFFSASRTLYTWICAWVEGEQEEWCKNANTQSHTDLWLASLEPTSDTAARKSLFSSWPSLNLSVSGI